MSEQVKKGMMSTLRSKIGEALALKPALKSTLKAFDADSVWRRSFIRTEWTCGKDARKCKGSRDYQFHFSMCDVQRAGHQRKNQKNIISSTEQEGM